MALCAGVLEERCGLRGLGQGALRGGVVWVLLLGRLLERRGQRLQPHSTDRTACIMHKNCAPAPWISAWRNPSLTDLKLNAFTSPAPTEHYL